MDTPDYLDLTPSAVVCSRGKLGAQTYDAEVSFDKVHYVVATGCATHGEAKRIAQSHVDALIIALRVAGTLYLKPFPKAKP